MTSWKSDCAGFNQERCRPPLSERQIAAKIRHIWTHRNHPDWNGAGAELLTDDGTLADDLSCHERPAWAASLKDYGPARKKASRNAKHKNTQFVALGCLLEVRAVCSNGSDPVKWALCDKFCKGPR